MLAHYWPTYSFPSLFLPHILINGWFFLCINCIIYIQYSPRAAAGRAHSLLTFRLCHFTHISYCRYILFYIPTIPNARAAHIKKTAFCICYTYYHDSGLFSVLYISAQNSCSKNNKWVGVSDQQFVREMGLSPIRLFITIFVIARLFLFTKHLLCTSRYIFNN